MTEDIFTFPPIYQEDVQQEAELLRLQGITPHKGLILKSLSLGELLFSDVLPPSASLVFPNSTAPDPEVFQSLISWVMEQEELVREMVFNFLEDPTEQQLSDLLAFLIEAQLIEPLESPKSTPKFSDMVRNILMTHRYTLEELYQYAREVLGGSGTKRPESTIRQLLRRWKSQNLIHQDDQGRFYYKNEG